MMSNLWLLLTLLLSSCHGESYDCLVSVYHLPETLHNLPIKLSIGYDDYRIEAGQTRAVRIYKHGLNDVCIQSYSNDNQGHSSSIRFYAGYSGGELLTLRRTVFENRPNLCPLFSIMADEDCALSIR